MLSAAVTWCTRVVGAVTWRACVVGGCDVAYAGPSSGDVAVGAQRATRRGIRVVTWRVVCPHPSTRGGARALAWPVRAFARGSGDGGGGGMCVGGGERQSSDGAMFGNGWLPNIVIINNQCHIY